MSDKLRALFGAWVCEIQEVSINHCVSHNQEGIDFFYRSQVPKVGCTLTRGGKTIQRIREEITGIFILYEIFSMD